MDKTKILAQKIKMLRYSKKWKQEYVAYLLGISTAGYSKIENGITDLNITRLEQIAKLFDTTGALLLSDDSEIADLRKKHQNQIELLFSTIANLNAKLSQYESEKTN